MKKLSENIFQILSILAVGAMVWFGFYSIMNFICWLIN